MRRAKVSCRHLALAFSCHARPASCQIRRDRVLEVVEGLRWESQDLSRDIVINVL